MIAISPRQQMSGSQLKQFTNSVCFEIGRGDLAPGRMVTVITQSGGTHKIWYGMVWHGMVLLGMVWDGVHAPGQGEVTITASDSHRSKLAGLVVFGEQIVNVFSLH